ELDGCFLKVAIAEFIEEVHKHRGDAIEEGSGKVGEAREVDPPELLDGREAGGEFVRVDAATGVGESDAVIERVETITSWLPIFDGEADEVFGGGAGFPVHGEQDHSFATVQFKGKERCRVSARCLESFAHSTSLLPLKIKAQSN